MYDTPLFQAVEAYRAKRFARMHTPGHKGRLAFPFAQVASYDVTEIRGTDCLFEASGPILETETRYARLYHTQGSFLSAGGSTLCIQAMLALLRAHGTRLLVSRNIHQSAVNAMALLGMTPIWFYPEIEMANGLPGIHSPQTVHRLLCENPDVAGVFLTSPNYFGQLEDIGAMAAVCRDHRVPLAIDNAHGAHLAFGEENLHPIHLGANLCCDSLHKTLPILTGGAILHLGDAAFLPEARASMALFGSTSPSYLIMLSIDSQLSFLEDETCHQAFLRTANRVAGLEALAKSRGFATPSGLHDPTRLTLGFWKLGYSREAFDQLLQQYAIEPEYLSEDHCVLLFSPHSPMRDDQRIAQLIKGATQGSAKPVPNNSLPHPHCALSLREALFAPHEQILVEDAEGRVAARVVSRCPPGVPLVVPGEKIDAVVKNSLKKYGVFHIDVVK